MSENTYQHDFSCSIKFAIPGSNCHLATIGNVNKPGDELWIGPILKDQSSIARDSHSSKPWSLDVKEDWFGYGNGAIFNRLKRQSYKVCSQLS